MNTLNNRKNELKTIISESLKDTSVKSAAIWTEAHKELSNLPEVTDIKSIYEIKIGDVLVYTGNPRGTGMYVPDIGTKWEMKTKNDLISASIEIIERGRGWRPILK